MERFILKDIPFSLPFDNVKTKLLLEDEDDILLMEEKLAEAVSVARPKAMLRVCYVDSIEGDIVTIDGAVFRSAIMAKNLKDIHRVFAYVVTCGTEVDEWSHLEQDYIVNLWLDMVKEMILHEARKYVAEHLKSEYGLPKLSSMAPGSGNADVWPIAQQQPLFGLLGDVEGEIGARLTESFLMLPTKTVSGIFFPSDKSFVTCALCSRENCTGRQAAYAPKNA